MSAHHTGRCLCGAVTFTAQTKSNDVSVCHCSMCNRWAGGVAMFLDAVGKPDFTGAENIGVYQSSEWGERGFCKTCGSNLFWKVAGKDRYTLSAGCIDDQASLTFAREIFVEDQPGHYAFANKTKRLTGEEAMQEYLGEGT